MFSSLPPLESVFEFFGFELLLGFDFLLLESCFLLEFFLELAELFVSALVF